MMTSGPSRVRLGVVADGEVEGVAEVALTRVFGRGGGKVMAIGFPAAQPRRRPF